MNGIVFDVFAAIRAVVDEVREAEGEDTGGCHLVTEWLEWQHGQWRTGGCFVLPDGRHAAHYWLTMPDDTFLDPTADQFGLPHPYITTRDDTRYIECCPCWD